MHLKYKDEEEKKKREEDARLKAEIEDSKKETERKKVFLKFYYNEVEIYMKYY
jgi:hypothetical protein